GATALRVDDLAQLRQAADRLVFPFLGQRRRDGGQPPVDLVGVAGGVQHRDQERGDVLLVPVVAGQDAGQEQGRVLAAPLTGPVASQQRRRRGPAQRPPQRGQLDAGG